MVKITVPSGLLIRERLCFQLQPSSTQISKGSMALSSGVQIGAAITIYTLNLCPMERFDSLPTIHIPSIILGFPQTANKSFLPGLTSPGFPNGIYTPGMFICLISSPVKNGCLPRTAIFQPGQPTANEFFSNDMVIRWSNSI